MARKNGSGVYDDDGKMVLFITDKRPIELIGEELPEPEPSLREIAPKLVGANILLYLVVFHNLRQTWLETTLAMLGFAAIFYILLFVTADRGLRSLLRVGLTIVGLLCFGAYATIMLPQIHNAEAHGPLKGGD